MSAWKYIIEEIPENEQEVWIRSMFDYNRPAPAIFYKAYMSFTLAGGKIGLYAEQVISWKAK